MDDAAGVRGEETPLEDERSRPGARFQNIPGGIPWQQREDTFTVWSHAHSVMHTEPKLTLTLVSYFSWPTEILRTNAFNSRLAREAERKKPLLRCIQLDPDCYC